MSRVQQYWLPGYGLSRHIVLGHIHYFLGPSASVRPFTYQGREGYLIVGVPLTREQIDDLAAMSREYERQEALRMAGDTGIGIGGDNGSNSSSTREIQAEAGAQGNGNGTGNGQAQTEPYINEIVPVNSRAGRRNETRQGQ